jgi:hypothetical protein
VEDSAIQHLHELFPSLIPLIGKKPFERDWQQWCLIPRPFSPKDFEGHNAGLPCGPANRILVVDVDEVSGFNAWLRKNKHKLPETRTHLTGSDKPHYIYGYPENGHRYGCKSFSHNGQRIFDIRGIGGQVVAPGSIHPDTKKKYTVHNDLAVTPAPEWLLELCRQNADGQEVPSHRRDSPRTTMDLDSLQLSYPIKKLITEGEAKGKRSEAIMSVLNALVKAHLEDQSIIGIFESYPIGEKYTEVGTTREKWLLAQVAKIRGTYQEPEASPGGAPTMADLKAYLDFEVEPGQPISSDEICRGLGAFKRQDRQNIYKGLSRLVETGELRRDPYRHGCYRRVSAIPSYDLISGVGKNDLLGINMPMELDDLLNIKPNQLVGVSGRYDSAKSSLLFDIEARNYENFKIVHILSEEWSLPAIKERQEILGIPVPHKNIAFYPMLPGWEDLIGQGPAITLIDYLRADKNPYEVDSQIQRVLRNLNGGVAFFACQKHPGLDKPVGGQFAIHSVHHILMLDRWKDSFVCKIFRTKNERNLEGYFRTFILDKNKWLVPKMENWKQGTLKWEKDNPDERS